MNLRNINYLQMKILLWIAFPLSFIQCQPAGNKKPGTHLQTSLPAHPDSNTVSYGELKDSIQKNRQKFHDRYFSLPALSAKRYLEEISDYWINTIGNDLFLQWQNTPWDFNGTTSTPHEGAIACGYFVTAMLQDMTVKLNRIKLSTCASSEMMKSLTPLQPIKRLNHLSYADFNTEIKKYGKGVYVIGLDFHTGFIVNDGKENWFIHSNYIGRKGVTKETVTSSEALQASKTRWVVSLTGDKDFLERWLRQ
jgi:hypothetical protein